MNVDVLIFSRNRAAQLDLLLRSIRLHAGGLYPSPQVLWRADTVRYRTAYQQLQRECHDLTFVHESRFDSQVRRWVHHAGPYLSFLCDDCVFFRDFPWLRGLYANDLPLSLRGGDYDYPFSLDGNIYRRRDVAQLLNRLPRFDGPNELEWFADQHRAALPFDDVNPLEPPCLVGIPLNKVSDLGSAPHMGRDAAEMNERWLAGERLLLPHIDGNPGAHAMIELEWSTGAVRA